jgi:hypothetical protein
MGADADLADASDHDFAGRTRQTSPYMYMKELTQQYGIEVCSVFGSVRCSWVSLCFLFF